MYIQFKEGEEYQKIKGFVVDDNPNGLVDWISKHEENDKISYRVKMYLLLLSYYEYFNRNLECTFVLNILEARCFRSNLPTDFHLRIKTLRT
jgi:hypothetical protein